LREDTYLEAPHLSSFKSANNGISYGILIEKSGIDGFLVVHLIRNRFTAVKIKKSQVSQVVGISEVMATMTKRNLNTSLEEEEECFKCQKKITKGQELMRCNSSKKCVLHLRCTKVSESTYKSMNSTVRAG